MNKLICAPMMVALCASLLATPAAAQQAELQQGERITLEQALGASAKRNPDVLTAAAELRRARLAVSREEARFTTNLTADLGYTLGSQPAQGRDGTIAVLQSNTLTGSVGADRTFSPGTRATASFNISRSAREDIILGSLGPGYSMGLKLGVTQPLLRGFGNDVGEANLRLARISSLSSIASQERAASAALRDVVSAYWELWYAQRSILIRKQSLQIARDSLAIGQLRVDAGALGQDELLALMTEVASGEEDVLAAELDMEQRSLTLSRQISGQALTSIQVADEGPGNVQVLARAEAVSQAEQRSVALRELEASVKTARVQAELARNNERIKLDATATFQLNGLSNDGFGTALGLFGSFQATQTFVGLSLALPVDNGALEDEAARAQLAVRTAELRYQTEQERLAQDITSRVASLERSNERLVLAQRTAELSAKSVAAEQVRYQAGESTALDVVRLLQRQREAELRILRLQADMAIAQAALEDAAGALIMRHADLIEQP
jgi:outer membrane protein TolC